MFLGVFRVNVKTQKNESVAAIVILMVILVVLTLYCFILDFPFYVYLGGDTLVILNQMVMFGIGMYIYFWASSFGFLDFVERWTKTWSLTYMAF